MCQPNSNSNSNSGSTPTLPPPAHPSADLSARGFSLYCSIFELLCAVFSALTHHLDLTHFSHTAKTLKILLDCLAAITTIKLTLLRAPQRVTPRQLVRLSRAARLLTRLTGRAFDFAPWAALTQDELDRLSPLPPKPNSSTELTTPAPPTPEPPSAAPVFTFPDFSAIREVRCLGILANPGATLANLCQNLIRLAPPDFPLGAVDSSSSTQPLSLSAAPQFQASAPPSSAATHAPSSAPLSPAPLSPASPTSPTSSTPAPHAPAPATAPAAHRPARVVSDPAFDRLLMEKFFPSRLPRPARPSSRRPPP